MAQSTTVTAPTDIRTTKRADDLSAGDRIAEGFLPARHRRHFRPAANVLWVHQYQLGDEEWVLVVSQVDGCKPDHDDFLADGQVPVDRLAPSDRTLGLPEAWQAPNTITDQRFPVRRFTQNGGPR